MTRRPSPTPLALFMLVLGAALALMLAPVAPTLAAGGLLELVVPNVANPRGMAFGPDGLLYVAEAGKGGEGPCAPGPEGEACFGNSGAIARVDTVNKTVSRVITGLPSLAAPSGMSAAGPHDVAFDSVGNVWFTIGLGNHPISRTTSYAPGGAELGWLGMSPAPISDSWQPVADIAGYEAATNPDGSTLDSNPFSLILLPPPASTSSAQGIIPDIAVSDAGGNSIIGVDVGSGVVQALGAPMGTLAVMPGGMAQNPFAPPGTMIPFQSVPTGMAHDGSNLWVGQLTGFPFPVGGAHVWKIDGNVAMTDSRTMGFTNILDIALDDSGNLYVLEMVHNGLLGAETDPMGSLVRVAPDGTRTTLADAGLVMPTGMTLGPDGFIYISNFGIFSDVGGGGPTGQVVRINPNAPTSVTLGALESSGRSGWEWAAAGLMLAATAAILVGARRRRA